MKTLQKTRSFCSLFCIWILSGCLNAQLSDNYSNAGPWSAPVNNDPCVLEVDLSSQPGVLTFSMLSKTYDPEYLPAYIFRNLNGDLTGQTQWRAEFEYKCTTPNTDYDVGAILLSVSENDLHPDDTPISPYPLTQNDGIMVTLANDLNVFGPNTTFIEAKCKVGTGTSNNPNVSSRIYVDRGPNSPTYYIRLERQDMTHGQLSVFSNAGRTNHLQGSPVCFEIPEGMRELDYIHHGIGHSGSISRVMNGTLDNLNIYHELAGEPCAGAESCRIVSKFNIQISEETCLTSITDQAYGIFGTTIMYPIIVNFGGGSISYLNQGGTIYHYFPPFYSYNIKFSIFGYDQNLNCCRKDTVIHYTSDCEGDGRDRRLNVPEAGSPDAISINIYPNPSKGSFFVETGAYAEKLEIIDLSGKIIWQKTKIKKGIIPVDISASRDGLYLLKMYSGNGKIRTKKLTLNMHE